MTKDYDYIRNDFPILTTKVHGHPLVYLDSAASTLKPKCVIDRVNDYYSKESANVHRGVHYLSEQGTIKFEQARSTIGSFINAKSDNEIIFTKGTTESLNLVAQCLDKLHNFTSEDVILLSTMEHHSNIVPWQLTGAKVIEIQINDAGEIDLDHYKSLLNSHKVRVVSICHISNTLGTVNPVKEMTKLAHEVGALFCLDAAQSIVHMPIDVIDLNIDFLAFSGHKAFAPMGTGVLYGKETILEKLPPYQGGGAMIDKVSFEGTTFNQLPQKFEAGTPHVSGFVGLDSALQYVSKIGFDHIIAHERELITYLDKKLLEISHLKIIGTSDKKVGASSFVIKDVHPHDLGTLLDRQGIAVRTGHHCTQPLMKRFNINATTRASLCIYNNKQDIDKLIDGINKSLELL